MPEIHPFDEFKRIMSTIDTPRILLTGAKAWPGSVQPDHKSHVPNAEWTTTDIESGDGVDRAFDLQKIPEDLTGYFDGIYSPATLEHVERPWLAIHEMTRSLKPGGALCIGTHQTFPLHGYPNDYFRFSTEALSLMCRDSGLNVLFTCYDSPCTITPSDRESVLVWNNIATSFLSVAICAQKQP